MDPAVTITADDIARAQFRAHMWSGVGRSFRGSITDYARTVSLGDGYIGDWQKTNLCRNCRARGGIERCRHFEIDSARQLAGPFKAIEDPNVRTMMLLKAAQNAGSMTWDMSLHYLIVISPFMRIKVLLDSEDKAKAYCQQRLMDTLKANKDITPLLPTGTDRFGVTDTELRLLNGKTLFVGGLNDSNASSLPSDIMVVDEGWLHQADGLMKKALNRLKQTSGGKFIIVGQAGKVKEDQDEFWTSLDKRVPVIWACPECGGRQQFELHKMRPAEFVPTPRPGVLADDLPKPGSYVGFKIEKKISELNSKEEIAAACQDVKIECYHCGFLISDTPHYRQKLNDSFEQEYQLVAADGTRYTPQGYQVGFWNPDPASMFVPWRETMREYIEAEKSAQSGNIIPLQDFYLARWAQPWDPNAQRKDRTLEIFEGAYEMDPLKLIPNFHSRNMAVDSQKSLDAGPDENVVGSFWYVIRDFDKAGNSRQVSRGFVTSWADLFNRQEYWKVLNFRVVIDVAQWEGQIANRVANHFAMFTPSAPAPGQREVIPYPMCWRLYRGDANAEFMIRGTPRPMDEGVSLPRQMVTRDGRPYFISLFRYRWSNLAFENQLDAILSGVDGMPKFESLPRSGLRLPSGEPDVTTLDREKGVLAYDQQMSSRYLTQKMTVKGPKYYWQDLANREAHYRDCELMLLARASQDGLLGHVKAE